MQTQFHNQLEAAILEPFMARSDGPALGRFALQYGLFMGAAALLCQHSRWGQLAGIAGVAWSIPSLFAMTHESGHFTAFRTKALNNAVNWLAGTPIYYIPTGFRSFHFAHHRHTHDPQLDPEIALLGHTTPVIIQSPLYYLSYMSGLPLIGLKMAIVAASAVGTAPVWKHFLPYVPERWQAQQRREGRSSLIVHGLALALALYYRPTAIGNWAVAQALGHALLSVYLISEHQGLPHTGTILERTRTTLTHPLIRWQMWNMPYHAEHHAYPAVPWHALPQLHAHLTPIWISGGYCAFHQQVIQEFFQRSEAVA